MEEMRLRGMEQLSLITKKLLRQKYTYDKVNNVVL